MLVFLKLAARLQNEDNEQCLQFIVICLRKLFTSITESLFIDLHSAAADWLSARKVFFEFNIKNWGAGQFTYIMDRSC